MRITRSNGSRGVFSQAVVFALVQAFALPLPMVAGVGIININQHRVGTNIHTAGDCPNTNRPEPPYLEALDTPEINATSYHAFPHPSGGTDRDWPYYTARCYSNHTRPRIISDDADFAGSDIPLSPRSYIEQVCADIDSGDPRWPKGHTHYEHFNQYLSYAATAGDSIAGCTHQVDGCTTWPGDAHDMLDWIRDDADVDCNDVLAANGNLAAVGNLLKWNNTAVTLIGFGYMGAVAAGDRLDIEPYLRALRTHQVNFTRIWLVEQWTAQSVCTVPPTAGPEGLTPWVGTFATDYQLDNLNSTYFQRLRRFVQAAADRGIVVQLSLFDKHNLSSFGCRGHWGTSPYSNANHVEQYMEEDPDSCTCNPCVDPPPPPGWDSEVGGACAAVPDFIINPDIEGVNQALARRVAQEVAGSGNVIFEIINEQRFGVDWHLECVPANCTSGACLCAGERWQIEMAEYLNGQLPRYVARDAFNAEASETGINGKAPDAGNGTWTAANTWIDLTADPETGIQMGQVRSGESGSNNMRGALSLGSVASPVEFQVRGNVNHGDGAMQLGFATNASLSGDLIRVEVGESLLLSVQKRIAIVKRIGGFTEELAATTLPYGASPDLRLNINVSTRRATVYLDGAAILSNIDLEEASLPALTHAYFRGVVSTAPYAASDGYVDNFEAVVY